MVKASSAHSIFLFRCFSERRMTEGVLMFSGVWHPIKEMKLEVKDGEEREFAFKVKLCGEGEELHKRSSCVRVVCFVDRDEHGTVQLPLETRKRGEKEVIDFSCNVRRDQSQVSEEDKRPVQKYIKVIDDSVVVDEWVSDKTVSVKTDLSSRNLRGTIRVAAMAISETLNNGEDGESDNIVKVDFT